MGFAIDQDAVAYRAKLFGHGEGFPGIPEPLGCLLGDALGWMLQQLAHGGNHLRLLFFPKNAGERLCGFHRKSRRGLGTKKIQRQFLAFGAHGFRLDGIQIVAAAAPRPARKPPGAPRRSGRHIARNKFLQSPVIILSVLLRSATSEFGQQPRAILSRQNDHHCEHIGNSGLRNFVGRRL